MLTARPSTSALRLNSKPGVDSRPSLETEAVELRIVAGIDASQGYCRTPQHLHDFVVEVLKALGTYHLSYSAVARYDKRARLKLLSVPTLISSSPSDPLIAYVDEVAALVPGSRIAIVGDTETDDGAQSAAAAYRPFLDTAPAGSAIIRGG